MNTKGLMLTYDGSSLESRRIAATIAANHYRSLLREVECSLYVPDQTKDEPTCVACGRSVYGHAVSGKRGPAAMTPERWRDADDEDDGGVSHAISS